MQDKFPSVTFNSDEERKQAAVIIAETTRIVDQNNALFEQKLRSFEMKLYPFSYQNYSEFAKSYLGAETPVEQNPEVIQSTFSSDNILAYPECQNLPTNVDWRTATPQVIPPIQRQICGDCYLFAASTTVEAHAAIAAGKSYASTSRQQLLSCVKEFAKEVVNDGLGCKGGHTKWIYRHSRDSQGLVLESDFNEKYEGVATRECNLNLPRNPDTIVDHWERIADGDEKAMKCFVARHGPLSVYITIGKTTFGSTTTTGGIANFAGGVWDDPEGVCKADVPIDHAGEHEF